MTKKNKRNLPTGIIRIGIATLLIAFASAIGFAQRPEQKQSHRDVNGKFILPQLSYAADALKGVFSERAIELHYGKHLKRYVDNLNDLIAGSPLAHTDLVEIVRESSGALFNNAGQTLNHYLYFETFTPHPRSHRPTGELLQAIERKWGSFEAFKKAFSDNAASLFGSGWVWLSYDRENNLYLTEEKDAGNPVTRGYIPLLTFDVWEHAYYPDYENRRPEYIEKLWGIIDWDVVEKRFAAKAFPHF